MNVDGIPCPVFYFLDKKTDNWFWKSHLFLILQVRCNHFVFYGHYGFVAILTIFFSTLLFGLRLVTPPPPPLWHPLYSDNSREGNTTPIQCAGAGHWARNSPLRSPC